MTEVSALPGVNILLEGPSGTGKTYSLGTIAESGYELFVLFTEPGLESLVARWADQGLPIPDNVHWHILPQAAMDFGTLEAAAKVINEVSQDALHKRQDTDRAKHNQFVKLFAALNNFPDDRTGTKFGPVDGWGTNRCLALDGLTNINPIALSLVVGAKPVKSQADWGIAQDQIEKLLRKLSSGCVCHFALTAHVEREQDMVEGGIKLTVSTLGRALAPKIPPMFSDVILSVKEGAKFSWSTAYANADLKARNLPIASGISPTFKQIFDKWRSRGGRP